MRRIVSGAVGVLAGGLLLPMTASAATVAPFTQGAFDRAQAAGRPILVEIDASWCPTCAKQRPILSRLEAQPAFDDLVVLKVDFDSQKNVVREMGARMQSTLIVFRGRTEEARSVGETREAAIKAMMDKAVAG